MKSGVSVRRLSPASLRDRALDWRQVTRRKRRRLFHLRCRKWLSLSAGNVWSHLHVNLKALPLIHPENSSVSCLFCLLFHQKKQNNNWIYHLTVEDAEQNLLILQNMPQELLHKRTAKPFSWDDMCSNNGEISQKKKNQLAMWIKKKKSHLTLYPGCDLPGCK